MQKKDASSGFSYIGSLRAVVHVAAWVLLIIFALAAAGQWARTVQQNERELEHTADLFEQSILAHFTSAELFLTGVGKELLHLNYAQNPVAANEFLQRMSVEHQGVLGFAFIEPDGAFAVTNFIDPAKQLPLISEMAGGPDYLADIMNEPRFHLGQPYYFPYFEQWIAPLRAPIFNDDGVFAGYMSVGVALESNLALFGRLVLPENVQVALIRNNHHLAYIHPFINDIHILAETYQNPVSADLIAVLNQPDGMYLYQRPTADHQGYEPVYAYIENFAEYELRIAVFRPRSVVQQQWLHGLWFTLLILVAAALALWLAYRRAYSYLSAAERQIELRQRALVKSLEQYTQLTTLTPAGVYQIRVRDDGEREFVYLSARCRQMFAMPMDLSLKAALAFIVEITHPEDIESFVSVEENAVAKNKAFRWEGRFIVNNAEMWVSIQSQPGQHDGVGRIYHGVMLDITEHKNSLQQIEALAHYDTLTQLPNRNLLQQQLQKFLIVAQSEQRYGAVVLIDIDHFKVLNDSLGQAAGDEVLRAAGERFQQLIRRDELAARLAADEFVLLLTQCGTSEAEAVARVQRVVQAIQQAMLQPFALTHDNYLLTVSIGVSVVTPHSLDAERVLQQADQAMYAAKESGRNTWVMFDANMEARMNSRLELQRDLHRGIQNNELELHFQPKVNRQRVTVGVEALVRWRHPLRGIVPPAEFISIAEQSTDIILLGQWVLRAACVKLVEWEGHPHRNDWTMAVNVSVVQLRAGDFVQQVLDVLAETGARPGKLILEITESMLLGDTEAAIAKMQLLREHGVRFSLDDFGTGYSSLSYLQRLPVDQLKIDRSFVAVTTCSSSPPGMCVTDTDSSENVLAQEKASDNKLTRSIIDLGHNLGLIVVAEGVETEAQFAALLAQGCDVFQGYLFSPPVRSALLPDDE